jgi:putative IMPACT (imprinted ancient) family translation regulator
MILISNELKSSIIIALDSKLDKICLSNSLGTKLSQESHNVSHTIINNRIVSNTPYLKIFNIPEPEGTTNISYMKFYNSEDEDEFVVIPLSDPSDYTEAGTYVVLGYEIEIG